MSLSPVAFVLFLVAMSSPNRNQDGIHIGRKLIFSYDYSMPSFPQTCHPSSPIQKFLSGWKLLLETIVRKSMAPRPRVAGAEMLVKSSVKIVHRWEA
jgi:hypothetical protein